MGIEDPCGDRDAGGVVDEREVVDEDRYCIDIVTQISAVRAALRKVEEEIGKERKLHAGG